MTEESVWYQGIRDIHDCYFQESWEERVDVINQRYDLSGDHMLLTHGVGVPMPWFNGDIHAVKPRNWVLVVSLNHHIGSDAPEDFSRQSPLCFENESYWNGRRTFHTDRWYRRFFGPLTRVAATALQENVTADQESTFATNRMIFVEICPYASNKFNLSWAKVAALLKSDLGFQLASRVNHLLIKEGDPAIVMVNGRRAVDLFHHQYADALHWREIRYDSPDTPRDGRGPKRLRHFCGSLRLGKTPTPIVGYPFLRTRSTHNSNQEIALLGDQVRECLRTQSFGESSISAT